MARAESLVSTPDVAVVGAGVVGAASALYLARAGAHVTLLDRGEPGHGASYGNAGLVVPSYCLPMANPAALRSGLGWLLQRDAPLSIRPRLDLDLAGWLLRFSLACLPGRAERAGVWLAPFAAQSLRLHNELAAEADPSYQLRHDGWLYLYRTEDGLAAGHAEAAAVRALGVHSETLDRTALREREPMAGPGVIGAIWYPGDASVQPWATVHHLVHLAQRGGVTVMSNAAVRALRVHAGNSPVLSVEGGAEIRAQHVVLAAGAWTAPLLHKLVGLSLPMEPAKGHSMTFVAGDTTLRGPVMMAEEHVVATPMGARLRLTTGIDLAGFDPSLDPAQIARMRRALPAYTNLPVPAEVEEWSGYRPLTPDGLPVLGPLRRFPNVVLATGHGTLGITLAPISGLRVAEMIAGGTVPADVRAFLPARFGL
jgi:D-amino-acid dehydrogenase